MELTHFVTGSVMFSQPISPYPTQTGPASLFGVLRVVPPHIIDTGAYNYCMWFLLIIWVFSRKNDAE